jgi:hypothetical protein
MRKEYVQGWIVKKETTKDKRKKVELVSRVYHVRESAQQLVEMLNKQAKQGEAFFLSEKLGIDEV